MIIKKDSNLVPERFVIKLCQEIIVKAFYGVKWFAEAKDDIFWSNLK